MPHLLEQPTKRPVPKQLTPFTSETATLARRKRTEYERKLAAIPTPQALAHNTSLDDFNALRIVRVREQLVKLDAMLAKETDPQKLDRLASAQARLSEQERILDGRPLPGSRRPKEDRTPRGGSWIELQPALPAPAAQVQPVRPMGWEYDDPGATPCAELHKDGL